MKKRFLIVGLIGLALFSCTEKVGEKSVDKSPENKVKVEEKISQAEDVSKDSNESEMQMELSTITESSDFVMDSIFVSAGTRFALIRQVTYEELDNTENPENPLLKIMESEQVNIVYIPEDSYYDCSHSDDKVPVSKLESKWKTNTDIPMRFTIEEGKVTEWYFDECSG